MGRRRERLWTRAEAHLRAGNQDAASVLYEAIVVDDPRDVPARLRLATLALRSAGWRAGERHASMALEARPADPVQVARLAGLLTRYCHAEAVVALSQGEVIARCRSPAVLAEMALLLSRVGVEAQALALLERAFAHGIDTPEAHFLHGTLLTHCGRIDDAEGAYERCLARAPAFAKAHWALSKLKRHTAGSNHVVRVRAAMDAVPAASPGEADLAFALFKELDDLGRHDEAWDALERGCRAKRARSRYDSEQDRALFDALMARCDAAFLSTTADALPGPVPIFIVGLPRSGTTLLERMLGNHPDVANAGELLDFPVQLRWSCDHATDRFLDETLVARAASIDFDQLGARYMARTAWRARGRSHFTDKLPPNFLQVGFIHRALPRARIVHMRRDPMESCFSNLKELFATAYPHSYDQAELTAYHRQYERLMAHWHAHLPGRILDVDYADLVEDPDAALARVFAFCGLAPEPDCSRPERNTRPVSTASSVQVREAVTRRFLGNWKPYGRHLAPLRGSLRQT